MVDEKGYLNRLTKILTTRTTISIATTRSTRSIRSTSLFLFLVLWGIKLLYSSGVLGDAEDHLEDGHAADGGNEDGTARAKDHGEDAGEHGWGWGWGLCGVIGWCLNGWGVFGRLCGGFFGGEEACWCVVGGVEFGGVVEIEEESACAGEDAFCAMVHGAGLLCLFWLKGIYTWKCRESINEDAPSGH